MRDIRHHRHPALKELAANESRSERIARQAVDGMGSVRFIIIQTVIVAAWITTNLAVLAFRWDAYPFILLNLVFSTQAAYAAPLILLAARQADTKRDALANHDHNRIEAQHLMLTCMHASPDTGSCVCADIDKA